MASLRKEEGGIMETWRFNSRKHNSSPPRQQAENSSVEAGDEGRDGLWGETSHSWPIACLSSTCSFHLSLLFLCLSVSEFL